MQIDVTPRRTVGITGFDVGGVTRRLGIGQTCLEEMEDGTCMQYSTDPTGGFVGPSLAANAGSLQTLANNQFGGAAAPIGTTPTTGINWNQLFAPLTSAAGAIGAGFAASELKPGQSLAANGTVVTGAGTTLPGSSILGSSSSLMPILLLGGGALLLVMMMGRR